MIRLKPTSLVTAREYNIENIFPDISDILKANIESSDLIKKEIIDYIKKDKAGIQFNCVRLCKVPDPPEELERKVDELEFQLSEMEDDELEENSKYKQLKKELYIANKELTKLKNPHKFFDDLCEGYKICPLYQKGIAPNGEKCPFELHYISNITEGYMNDLEVDLIAQNVDKGQIIQLVISDLLIYRATRALASFSLTTINEKMTATGKEYIRSKSYFVDIRNDELKNKQKLLESMIGTREFKKRYKIGDNKTQIQKEAEKVTADMIKKKESIKSNKVPNLIQVNKQPIQSNTVKIEDVEVVE